MREFFIGASSLLIGAFLQYVLAWLKQNQESKNRLLTDTCLAYLDSVAEIKFNKTENKTLSLERYLKANSFRHRVTSYC